MGPNNDLTTLSSKEADLLALLRNGDLPKHVAVIMDGNGRWAERQGLPRIAGHRAGIQSVREAVTLCRELGIQALTMYAFSTENWQRPQAEVSMLMRLLEEYLQRELQTMMNNGIRFKTIGRTDRLPVSVQDWIRKVEETTASNKQMVLTIALSYSGRTEMLDAVRRILKDYDRKLITPDELGEELFSSYLSTDGLPDPDLLIRTSGEMRISNFLLWQSAYTELYFTKTLWPDFRRRDLLLALLDYHQRERRFGLAGEQIQQPRKGKRVEE
jgi:undecaprenyl diphosphate synthase